MEKSYFFLAKQAIPYHHDRLVLSFSNISSQGKATDIEEETASHLTQIFLFNYCVTNVYFSNVCIISS